MFSPVDTNGFVQGCGISSALAMEIPASCSEPSIHYIDVLMSVSNHQPHDCLLNHLFKRRSKKTSELHGTGLCVGNSLVTSEIPTQMASNVENVSI